MTKTENVEKLLYRDHLVFYVNNEFSEYVSTG